MKKIILILLFNSLLGYSQCDYQVNNRPDGNVIKYFNPKPIIRQSGYEVGVAINYNSSTKKYYINLTVLLKNINYLTSFVGSNLRIKTIKIPKKYRTAKTIVMLITAINQGFDVTEFILPPP